MEMLGTRGDKIVDALGRTVRLRGACVGGWMNLEHFLNGYPGSEHGIRRAMRETLGAEEGAFFFERLLDYFFAREDVAFLRQCGATVVRLPLNYRHFESDEAPFEYLEAGFARLDRALAWCEEYGLYAILDLHAVQGCQSSDWHCDNASRHSAFWEQRQFQDRFVALWAEFARRYRGRAVVAGYNVMNEPLVNAPDGRMAGRYTPDWPRMNRIYRRVVEAIRAIDAEHIIFLEGDYFSTLFSGLEAPFSPNLVYRPPNYTPLGFGPGAYPAEGWDRAAQEKMFLDHEGTRFTRQHEVPLWVGEFGSTYNRSPAEVPDRLRAIDDEISIFEQYGAHWTAWTYKDVGAMGMVGVPARAAYRRAIAPSVKAQRDLDLEMFWMTWMPTGEVAGLIGQIAGRMVAAIGDEAMQPAAVASYLSQAALACYGAELAQATYARCFAGQSHAALEAMLSGFSLAQCERNEGLIQVMSKYMRLPA
jgi:hypothetical protein